MTSILCCRGKFIALTESSRYRINCGLVTCTVGILCPLPHQAAQSSSKKTSAALPVRRHCFPRRDAVARFTKLIPDDMCSL
jgi:hypothetical protein